MLTLRYSKVYSLSFLLFFSPLECLLRTHFFQTGMRNRPKVMKIHETENLDLDYTAPRWKMTCYDADDGIFGLDTLDPMLGVEIVKTKICRTGGLGLNLIEYKRAVDGRSMVLIESITPGSNAEKSGTVMVGDTITAVGLDSNMSRTEGLGLDDTLDAIGSASPEASELILVLKRLVKRRTIRVTFVNNNGDESTYNILAGSNLRSEMIKKNIQVYDSRTKRFDQPYITGDCAGEGICERVLWNAYPDQVY